LLVVAKVLILFKSAKYPVNKFYRHYLLSYIILSVCMVSR